MTRTNGFTRMISSQSIPILHHTHWASTSHKHSTFRKHFALVYLCVQFQSNKSHLADLNSIFPFRELNCTERNKSNSEHRCKDVLFIKMLIRCALFSINQKNDHCSFSYFQASEEEHSRNTDYTLCFPLNLTNHNEDRSILTCRKKSIIWQQILLTAQNWLLIKCT